ncbi:MAG TPA: hypothetical protein VJB13_03975 [Candidatus Nanoarchaeia archaeon]|nr:hypothetical protein [Candidatus Nanoarchaeia archaeon]
MLIGNLITQENKQLFVFCAEMWYYSTFLAFGAYKHGETCL